MENTMTNKTTAELFYARKDLGEVIAKAAFKKANTFFRFENRILSVLRSGGHTPRALARVSTSFGWKQTTRSTRR